jgi:hypothetical protein
MPEPIEAPDPSDTQAIKIRFLRALPRIKRYARVEFGDMRGEEREEAIQRTLGLAWKFYLAAVEKGQDPGEHISTIAKFSVRQVRAGRDVAGKERAEDVLSPRARKRNGIEVQALPEDKRSADDNESIGGLCRRRESLPEEAAQFHHDFPMLVDELSEKQAAVVLDAVMGDGTNELASKHCLSPARISQIRTLAKDKWTELGTPPADRGR